MEEAENASLAEVLLAVKAVTKRFDDVKAKNPNGFLVFPVQSRADPSDQNRYRLCRKDNDPAHPTSRASLNVKPNHKRPKEKTVEDTEQKVCNLNNDSSGHYKNKNKLSNRTHAFPAKSSVEIAKEKILIMKGHQRTKHTAESHDKKVCFKCGQELVKKDGINHEGRITIHKPTVLSGRTRNERDTGLLSSKDVKMVDKDYWHNLGRSETRKGKHTRDRNKIGIDTIICLDTSASMEGKPWTQAMEFVREYIKCVHRATDHTSDSCEHLGLVVFGHETEVLQHMTTKHAEVLQKLDFLYTDGPTPLLGAIHMCMALVSGSGAGLGAGRLSIEPRVLLITDGHLTKSNMVAGPDAISPVDRQAEQRDVLELIVMFVEADIFTISPVPVGDDPDTEFLEKIASVAKGKVISPDKWKQASRFYRIVDIAGKASFIAKRTTDISEDTANESGLNTDRMRINDRVSTVLVGESDDASSLWVPYIQQMEGATDEDMEEVKELIKNSKVNRTGENKYHVERSSSLPKLGSRVKRGADWMWGDQDMGGTGTVVNHCAPPYENWIRVVWDKKPDSIARYRFGADDRFDVEVVDDPRILQPEELIAVGCIVTRGDDWSWHEQDGGTGNTGIVLKVNPNGTVVVRWTNGNTYPYRFGHEGKFDLKICLQNIGGYEGTNMDLGSGKNTKAVNKNKLVEMKSVPGLNESPRKGNKVASENIKCKSEAADKRPPNESMTIARNVAKQGKSTYKEDLFVIGAEGMELISDDSE